MASSSLLSECDGGPIETVPSLWHYLRHGFQINPQGIAVISAYQKSDRLAELLGTPSSAGGDHQDETLICTYGQLYDGCLKLCAGLIQEGVKPGDTISVFVHHGIEFVLLKLFAALLKITLGVLDPGSLLPARREQLLGFLKITKPAAVVVTEAAQARVVEGTIETLGLARPIGIFLQSCSVAPAKWKSLADVMRIGATHPADEEALQEAALDDSADRIAWIYFTSGTSAGSPKGCPRTVHSIVHFVKNLPLQSVAESGKPIRMILPTVNYRIAAGASVYTTLQKGHTMIFSSPAFDPGSFIRAVEKWEAETTILIPSQFYDISRHPEFSPARMKSLVMMGTGGDIITRGHFEIIKRMFPSVFLYSVVYGMTEGSGWVMAPFPPSTPLDQIPFIDDICPIGRTQPGTRVRIWDPVSKDVVRRGETGELAINSQSILPQYLGSNTANENGFYTDKQGLRWFRTGDRATMTDSGLIYITGRISNIFKRGGVPVDPVALEKNIASFIGSDQLVCVVPVPSKTLGHVPLAVVSSLAGKTKTEILHHNTEKFGEAYDLVDVIELKDLGLDTWPINSAGKVMKTDILAAVDRTRCAKGIE